MPNPHFKLANSEPLEISWRRGWRDMHVAVSGVEVGTVADKSSLKQGRDFTLPDGSKLIVRLGRLYVFPQLEVLQDGTPVAGSATDPRRQLTLSWKFTVAGGLLALFYGLQSTVQPDSGFVSSHSGVMIGLGITQIALGLFVRARSLNALLLAVGTHSIALTFKTIEAMPGDQGMSQLPILEMLLGVSILLGMLIGPGAVSKLRAENKPSAASSQSDTWGRVFRTLPLMLFLPLVPALLVMLILHKTVGDMAAPYLAFTVPCAAFVFVAKGLRSWEEHGATPKRLAVVWSLCLAVFMVTVLGATMYAALTCHLIAQEDAIGGFAVAAGGCMLAAIGGYRQVLKTATERAAKRQGATRPQ